MSTQRKYVPDLLIMTKDTDPDLRFMALIDLERELTISINNSGSGNGNIGRSIAINYANVLLRCLDDEFAEVRTQSLKSFQTLPWILDADIVNVIKELVGKNRKKESITSTIYTMALHNIMMNLQNGYGLNQSVINCILPKVMNVNSNGDVETDIDGVEILSDVVEYSGKYMSKEQIANVMNYLADIIFHSDNLLAKKAVYISHVMIGKVENKQENIFIAQGFFDKIMAHFEKNSSSKECRMKLLSVLAATISGNPAIMETRLQNFWKIICECLDLANLGLVDDDYEVQQAKDTVRYEALIAMSRIFESCKGTDIENFADTATRGLGKLVLYDPYGNNEQNKNHVADIESIDWKDGKGGIAEILSDDDEVHDVDENADNLLSDDSGEEDDYGEIDSDEYSDFEDAEDDDDDDDDCSWKVRCEALTLLNAIITKFPLKLPECLDYNFANLIKAIITESNSNVQNNVILAFSLIFESCSEEGAYYSLKQLKQWDESLSNASTPYGSQFMTEPASFLFDNKGRILKYIYKFLKEGLASIDGEKLALIIKMLTNMSYALTGYGPHYSQLFIAELFKNPRSILFESGISSFILALLTFGDVEDLGMGVGRPIHEYIKFCFSNESNHKLIMEGIIIADKVFTWSQTMSDVDYILIKDLADNLTNMLVEKASDKSLSTEIRQKALDALVKASNSITLPSETCDQFMSVLADIISSEVLAFSALKAITSIHNLGNPGTNWVDKIVGSTLKYVHMSEVSLGALGVLRTLLSNRLIDERNSVMILATIVKFHQDKKISSENADNVGVILCSVVGKVDVVAELSSIISVLADLISFDLSEYILMDLMRHLLSQVGAATIEAETQNLRSISISKVYKLSAVLAVASSNEDHIREVIGKLNNSNETYFSLVFLNQVAKSIDLGIDIDVILNLFDSEDPNVVLMAIKTVSTLVSEYAQEYFDKFLDFMSRSTDLKHSFTALSIILSSIEPNDEQAEILEFILTTQGASTGNIGDSSIYEDASKCLAELAKSEGSLCRMTGVLEDLADEKRVLLATLGGVVKYALSSRHGCSEDEWRKYLELSVTRFIWSGDLALKLIGISNLNVILNKNPVIAIPLINKLIDGIVETEVKPNKDYIHTQQIGPYKHKIDDGLTYRKQVFDVIYYLLKALQENKRLEFLCNIKWENHFNRFFDYGIKDDQTIASVCLLATLKLFEQDPYFFGKNADGVDIFEAFISRCRKALNKKLADNSVKQDIEQQNNLIKMTVRFSIKVNAMIEGKALILNGSQSSEWNMFINSTNSKFSSYKSED